MLASYRPLAHAGYPTFAISRKERVENQLGVTFCEPSVLFLAAELETRADWPGSHRFALFSRYGNPRPPSWMTPNSCAGGLPGFDPSGFKLGDVDVKPKFKFNLGKIKFKF